MKTILWILLAVAALCYSRAAETLPGIDNGMVLLPVEHLSKPAPW